MFSVFAVPSTSPTFVIRPLTTSTSARRLGARVPSTTVAPRSARRMVTPFSEKPPPILSTPLIGAPQEVRLAVAVMIGEGRAEASPVVSVQRSTRLYAGNLSFATSQEALRDAFAAVGEVREVAMPT